MGDGVLYRPEWQVLLCTQCGFCLRPGRSVWFRHLRQKPHCLRGILLKALVELFASYGLLVPEQVAVPT
jgi:Orsellinic acid/F9775 biosynthesis cluster protein D